MRRFIQLLILMFVIPLYIQAQWKSWTADNGNGTFTNPLFYDEFSDPDILRVGDDYYLAGTTMHTVPGLVILHSKDLVNWENISYCFDRFDFPDDAFSLKNHQEIYGQGVWAPAIRYANGQFYVFTNINGKGLQCYTSKDIRGPWKHHNMQGRIYDLSVLFDDDGKIYAIHGYGEVKCTELKADMSGPIEETERTIIPEGNAVGEGHHMYKINGMYYLISTDYKPNGRTLCSRSKSIWGPYETITITADETFGYHAAPLTQVPSDVRYRIGEDGTKFVIPEVDKDATACTNIHQGGIVEDQSGQWWALLMMDFHSIGRTVTLAPITWKEGWPMLYVHIPYCHRKCTYCAFYSTVTKGDKQAYVDALCEELRRRCHCMPHPLCTVYFGGGTPTLLDISQLAQIVQHSLHFQQKMHLPSSQNLCYHLMTHLSLGQFHISLKHIEVSYMELHLFFLEL